MMMNESIMKYPSLPPSLLFFLHLTLSLAVQSRSLGSKHPTPSRLAIRDQQTSSIHSRFQSFAAQNGKRTSRDDFKKSRLSVTSVNFRACFWYDKTNGCQMKRIMRGYVFVRLWQPHGPHTTASHWKLWHWMSRTKKRIEKLPDWSVFSLCNRARNAVCVPLELSKCPVVCVCVCVKECTTAGHAWDTSACFARQRARSPQQLSLFAEWHKGTFSTNLLCVMSS